MNAEVSKAAKVLIDALIALITLIVSSSKPAAASAHATAPAAEPEEPTTPGGVAAGEDWPKNLSMFLKTWKKESPKSEGFVGALFEKSSATTWTPEKIVLVVMGDAAFESSATSKEAIEAARNELGEYLGFDGELVVTAGGMGGAGAPTGDKPRGRGRPAGSTKAAIEAAKPAVTAEQVQAECVALATRTGKKTTVVEVLKRFGGSKVSEITPDKYAAIIDALRNYAETASDGATAEEF
jgi:hypothetical protein